MYGSLLITFDPFQIPAEKVYVYGRDGGGGAGRREIFPPPMTLNLPP